MEYGATRECVWVRFSNYHNSLSATHRKLVLLLLLINCWFPTLQNTPLTCCRSYRNHNHNRHEQEHFIDAAFALITEEWKYVYWPQKEYEQLYHRSLDPYDEYDILQNYYIIQEKHDAKQWLHDGEWERIRDVLNDTSKPNPVGDSIRSTKEIYTSLKARFYELKRDVQNGYRI